ncbi:MAG: heme-binding domain-containing protein [Acidimicrobiia bacterium]
MARQSCYSCHSNETDWPLYSYAAPMSWLVRTDVEEGREMLNFSEWDRDAGEADDAIDAIDDGSMPPSSYTRIHGDANLTAEEAQRVIDALAVMENDD